MAKYILKRILIMFVLLLGMTFLIFMSLHFAPGDTAELIAGANATPEDIERVREYLGLNEPLYVQYSMYLNNLLHLDLGTSLASRQPIIDELAVRLPHTLNLAIFSMILAVIFGVPAGIIAAINKDGWIDNLLTTVSLIGISIPNFWLGTMLILVFCVQLKIFPTGGMTEPFYTSVGFSQAILPGIALSLQVAAGFTRIGRSAMLDVMQSDYIRTAKSKGVKPRLIIFVHALKNALIPIVTQLGTSFGGLLGGAIITEQVFVINGTGTYLINAINQRNFPVVQSTVLIIASMFIIVNLIVDIVYCLIDPRISYE